MITVQYLTNNFLSQVESGFSVQHSIDTENLLEETIVAKRLVCDAVGQVNDIPKLVTPKMISGCAGAAKRYRLAVEKRNVEKECSLEEVQQKKRKLAALNEAEEMKRQAEQALEAANKRIFDLSKKDI
jgi:hypothetical protein